MNRRNFLALFGFVPATIEQPTLTDTHRVCPTNGHNFLRLPVLSECRLLPDGTNPPAQAALLLNLERCKNCGLVRFSAQGHEEWRTIYG